LGYLALLNEWCAYTDTSINRMYGIYVYGNDGGKVYGVGCVLD